MTGIGMDRVAASALLPATNCDLDVARIEFHSEADAARLLSGEERRAGAKEGIEHQIATA